jgi:uncharacterized DUF497 family protein
LAGAPGEGCRQGGLSCSAKCLKAAEVREKLYANRVKHGLSFETAVLVFDDPLHLSKPDPHPDGDRWHTIGVAGPVLLLVVHTLPDEAEEDEPVGRIISARKATAPERKAYEESGFQAIDAQAACGTEVAGNASR